MAVTKSQTPEAMLTPEEIADNLKYHIVSVYRLIYSKRIHAVKMGRVWRIPASEFRRIQTEGVDSLSRAEAKALWNREAVAA
jgi:excisionase family DNA binding protein